MILYEFNKVNNLYVNLTNKKIKIINLSYINNHSATVTINFFINDTISYNRTFSSKSINNMIYNFNFVCNKITVTNDNVYLGIFYEILE